LPIHNKQTNNKTLTITIVSKNAGWISGGKKMQRRLPKLCTLLAVLSFLGINKQHRWLLLFSRKQPNQKMPK